MLQRHRGVQCHGEPGVADDQQQRLRKRNLRHGNIFLSLLVFFRNLGFLYSLPDPSILLNG